MTEIGYQPRTNWLQNPHAFQSRHTLIHTESCVMSHHTRHTGLISGPKNLRKWAKSFKHPWMLTKPLLISSVLIPQFCLLLNTGVGINQLYSNKNFFLKISKKKLKTNGAGIWFWWGGRHENLVTGLQECGVGNGWKERDGYNCIKPLGYEHFCGKTNKQERLLHEDCFTVNYWEGVKITRRFMTYPM